ncbi:hypothetical protein BER93_07590 [Xanthomonas fragariae]|nr:hypothetical protein BER93_07590 [Xanthomonas fragariae]ENZ94847.1 hypothetical protein O1K_12946 [Xanthomonas fragariae LMG 25863]
MDLPDQRDNNVFMGVRPPLCNRAAEQGRVPMARNSDIRVVVDLTMFFTPQKRCWSGQAEGDIYRCA